MASARRTSGGRLSCLRFAASTLRASAAHASQERPGAPPWGCSASGPCLVVTAASTRIRTSALPSEVLWARPNEPRSEASSISALTRSSAAAHYAGSEQPTLWPARGLLPAATAALSCSRPTNDSVRCAAARRRSEEASHGRGPRGSRPAVALVLRQEPRRRQGRVFRASGRADDEGAEDLGC